MILKGRRSSSSDSLGAQTMEREDPSPHCSLHEDGKPWQAVDQALGGTSRNGAGRGVGVVEESFTFSCLICLCTFCCKLTLQLIT